MNLTKKKMRITLFMANALLGAMGVPAATEVAFTGEDATNPTNLSSSANWSATPGADTIGVIDLSQTPAQGYVVNADLALSGLRIKSNSGKAVTIAGTGTLTIGADGYVSGAKGKLTLECPLATSANQVWDFKQADFTTGSTISGSDEMVISNYTYCVHSATVNYGGTLKYYATTASSSQVPNKWVSYRGTGKWATHVITASGPVELYHYRAADIRYSDIFPSGCTWEGDSSPKFLSVCRSTSGSMIFDDGDSLSMSRHTYFTAVTGHFEQRGGTLTTSDNYYLVLGYADGNHVSTWPDYADPCIYRMKNGTLKAGNLLVGYQNKDATGAGVLFHQTGGTVQTAYASNYGGGLFIAGGGVSLDTSVAEYLLGGGTLSAAGYGNSPNLALCGSLTSGSVMPAALFTQTNGTASVRWISLGLPKAGTWRDGASPSINNGYARFELSGGTFSLLQSGWLKINAGWNDNASVSNSVYSFNFCGGDFRPATGTRWNVASRFPATGTGSEWGGTSSDISIVAPVSGSGTLVKKGTGGLLLSDATRFTGTLDVRGGVVSVDGGAEDIGASDADCFRWTADSLAATLADGDAVTDWTDVNNGVVATTNGNRYVELKKLGAPKFKAAAYNGHSAVTFNVNSLAVPQAMNPLYGKKSCTVVAVVKPTASLSTVSTYYGKVLLSVVPASTYSWMTVACVGDAGGTSGCRLGVGRRFAGDQDTAQSNYASRPGVSLNDNDIHAFAVSIDAEKVSFTVDGDYTNEVWTGGTAANVAPIGYGNRSWTPGTKGELFIGGHTFNAAEVAAFTGDILELRVYTNRLFTVAEQKQITKRLLQVYDGTPVRMAKFEKGDSAAPMGTPGGFTSWTAPEPVPTSASWDADTIAAADGESVSAWASADGTKTAAVPSGKNAPKLVKNAINGHAALRFAATGATALGVAAADSPISGATSFTAALVWRSTEKGTGTSIVHNGAGAGLVTTKQAAGKSADMALTYRSGSAVMAGYGHATADQDIATRKPCRLNDGEPHISILSCDGDGKKYRLMTDGVFFEGSLANVSARGAFDVTIGALRSGSTAAAEFFTGDIAAVKLYGAALTKDQMRDLGEFWAKRYATHLLVGHAFDESKLRERGLGATNVMVAAGARMSLPLSEDAPFTLKAGSTLSGAGEFFGSYRLLSGAVLDAAAGIPAFFDDLQLAGGTLKVSRSAAGPLKVRRLKVAGANEVEVAGDAELPRRVVLAAFDEADIAEGSTWVVRGSHTSLSQVVADVENGRLLLKTTRGATFVLR